MENKWYAIAFKRIYEGKPDYYLTVRCKKKEFDKELEIIERDKYIEKKWIIEDCEKYWQEIDEKVHQIMWREIDEKTLESKIMEIQNKIKEDAKDKENI